MPSGPPGSPSGPVLRRRDLLRAAVAVPALAACTDPPEPAPEPDPDVPLTEEAAARERALLDAYREALLAAPSLADRLAPLRVEHEQHLAALGVPATPTPSGSPAPPAAPPPADPAAVLAALADAERAASVRHGDAAVLAGRELAAVLAALAASEASHPLALA